MFGVKITWVKFNKNLYKNKENKDFESIFFYLLNIKNWSGYLDRLIEKISQVSDISRKFKAMVINAARSGVGEAPVPSSGGKVVVTNPNVHKAAPQSQAVKLEQIDVPPISSDN